ncbi:NAD(P)H-hydrate dehydratase [Clostridium aminobutyricum]|uniref:ADP-dependent (S)-NAD(P)H-hydrate dehydratase n=1 Tax=Clostridium aminobutyricum TaxID=33953 RepID=A0A939D882_CLOAM|nr:NAD(P)H-hydrate dehydratase [Clostridium aminobutyricum]MBN7772895.1 NAD(P)H-hydrate dehydratase [Clostridium aminobutyricum]
MKNQGLITEEYVNTVIKRRKRDIHKGDCGKVLLIAGSFGMAGAAVLCGWGALRSGAGLVRIAVPEELFTIIQVSVPEATCIPRTSLNMDLRQYDAIAVGPGLGEDSNNAELIKTILAGYDKTLVLDADGLNQISHSHLFEQLKKAACKVIITPHIGEAARLLQIRPSEAKKMERQELAEHLVQATNAIVVLKGEGTIVAMPNSDSYTNTTGNPGMATGGSGDVLTGIITALAGQGLEPEDAAKAGVYIHGLAGDLGTESFGEYGLVARDIASMSALAIKKIMG